MPEVARLALLADVALALRGHMADVLRADGTRPSVAALISAIGPQVHALSGQVDEKLGGEARRQSDAIAARLSGLGAPARLAQRVAHLFALDGAVAIAMLARDSGVAPLALVSAFVQVGELLGIDWAQGQAALANPQDPWERLLVAGLARDFQQMRGDLLRRLTTGASREPDIAVLVSDWAATHDAEIRRFRQMVGRAREKTPVAPAVLAQIASQARGLLQRA
jgi:glutamate dehydrogenase